MISCKWIEENPDPDELTQPPARSSAQSGISPFLLDSLSRIKSFICNKKRGIIITSIVIVSIINATPEDKVLLPMSL